MSKARAESTRDRRLFSMRRLVEDLRYVWSEVSLLSRIRLALLGVLAMLTPPLTGDPNYPSASEAALIYAVGVASLLLIVAFLRPLAKSRTAAAVIGALAVLPFITALYAIGRPNGSWDVYLIAGAISCVAFGAIPGAVMWSAASRR